MVGDGRNVRKMHTGTEMLFEVPQFQPKGESAIEEGEGIKAQWTVDPEFITEFCDLTIPKGSQAANMVDRRKSLERQQGGNIHYYTVLQILFLSRVRQFFHNMDANLLVNRGIMDFSTVIIPQFANRGIMTVLKSIIIRFVSKAYDYGFQYCHNHTVC